MDRRQLLKISAALAAAYVVPLWGKEGAATQPSHSAPATPNLLLNRDGIGALKARIASEPWAKGEWDSVAAHVNKAIVTPIDLPPRGGNWSHNYVCPTHGARLRQGKKLGPWRWEHICPIGPHTLLGDPSKATTDFDGNGIMDAHLNNADLLVDCGLVYQVLGDEGCAAYGRQLLMAYAAKYESYPMHDNKEWKGQGAHVASQPLTEASWLIGMAQGADLIWDTVPEEDRATAGAKLFYAAVNEILLKSKLGIHNIQCRINSAIGLVGFLYNDAKLIDIAINDPRHGYRKQLGAGVHEDGMWVEGSTGYHFFTIGGLWPLAEAGRNHGIDLYTKQFNAMFNGPIDLARPDNVLPNFNDSGDSPLSSHAADYELGLARFGNPEYAAIIRQADGGGRRGREKGSEDDPSLIAPPRQNRMAMLFGVSPLPPAEALPVRKSHNDTSSGYAVIQRGEGADATWLCVKYGPHGGGHGHPDKNHFILYTRKFVLCPDAGTHAYGSPLHIGWDKTTAAHNTLIVDENSQTAAEGKSIAFGTDGGVDYSVTHAGPIYPGVDFIRTAALIDENLVVFVDQITADKEHTFDMTYHQAGTWKDLPSGEKWKGPKAVGYEYFSGTTSRKSGDAMTLTTAHKNRGVSSSSMILAAGPETEVITGNGILQTTEDLVPMVMLRRKGKATTYVWAISLDGAAVGLEQIAASGGDGAAVAPEVAMGVKVTRGSNTWMLAANPSKKEIKVGDHGVSAAFAALT